MFSFVLTDVVALWSDIMGGIIVWWCFDRISFSKCLCGNDHCCAHGLMHLKKKTVYDCSGLEFA